VPKNKLPFGALIRFRCDDFRKHHLKRENIYPELQPFLQHTSLLMLRCYKVNQFYDALQEVNAIKSSIETIHSDGKTLSTSSLNHCNPLKRVSASADKGLTIT